jgi:hypothetical protein
MVEPRGRGTQARSARAGSLRLTRVCGVRSVGRVGSIPRGGALGSIGQSDARGLGSVD